MHSYLFNSWKDLKTTSCSPHANIKYIYGQVHLWNIGSFHQLVIWHSSTRKKWRTYWQIGDNETRQIFFCQNFKIICIFQILAEETHCFHVACYMFRREKVQMKQGIVNFVWRESDESVNSMWAGTITQLPSLKPIWSQFGHQCPSLLLFLSSRSTIALTKK